MGCLIGQPDRRCVDWRARAERAAFYVRGLEELAAVPSIGRAARIDGGLPPEADLTHALYEQYANQIFRYCLHQLGSREEAEDAVQSTFLNAFRGIKRGVVPELESAWLFKIAHNVCLSRRRTTWRRGRIESPTDFDVVEELAPAPSRQLGRADRPAGRPRAAAREPAARDPAARMAGPLLPRDRRGARALAGGRRDTHLPGAARARERPRAAVRPRSGGSSAAPISATCSPASSRCCSAAARPRRWRPPSQSSARPPSSPRRPSSSTGAHSHAAPKHARRAEAPAARSAPRGDAQVLRCASPRRTRLYSLRKVRTPLHVRAPTPRRSSPEPTQALRAPADPRVAQSRRPGRCPACRRFRRRPTDAPRRRPPRPQPRRATPATPRSQQTPPPPATASSDAAEKDTTAAGQRGPATRRRATPISGRAARRRDDDHRPPRRRSRRTAPVVQTAPVVLTVKTTQLQADAGAQPRPRTAAQVPDPRRGSRPPTGRPDPPRPRARSRAHPPRSRPRPPSPHRAVTAPASRHPATVTAPTVTTPAPASSTTPAPVVARPRRRRNRHRSSRAPVCGCSTARRPPAGRGEPRAADARPAASRFENDEGPARAGPSCSSDASVRVTRRSRARRRARAADASAPRSRADGRAHG